MVASRAGECGWRWLNFWHDGRRGVLFFIPGDATAGARITAAGGESTADIWSAEKYFANSGLALPMAEALNEAPGLSLFSSRPEVYQNGIGFFGTGKVEGS